MPEGIASYLVEITTNLSEKPCPPKLPGTVIPGRSDCRRAVRPRDQNDRDGRWLTGVNHSGLQVLVLIRAGLTAVPAEKP
jgi:hypothetical protein